MNEAMIDRIVQAVLYEGYILYPYRRSTKNQQRWTFGGVFPCDYSEATGGAEPHEIQSQCLLRGNPQLTTLAIKVRFLQVVDRSVGRRTADGVSFEPVDEVEVAGRRYHTWQEAVERSISVETPLLTTDTPRHATFRFPADQTVEPIHDADGSVAATLTRTQSAVEGTVEIRAKHERDDVFQLTVRIQNLTPLPQASPKAMPRQQALMHSMASTHVILAVTGGEFVSLIDPPPHLADLARQCRNIGVWPVLVGEPGQQNDAMLASPIILYDYPQVAPESPGDLFDGTEIDEILSLRVLTLSDEEKRSAADLDERGAALLRRTESLAREQLMRLHGTMRPPRKVEALHVGDAELRVGKRVRLRPGGGADAFDIMLRGKTATIAAIEQDYENRLHLAVTIDEDPGADIGAAGKIGHRFYFRPDEVEPLEESSGFRVQGSGEEGTVFDPEAQTRREARSHEGTKGSGEAPQDAPLSPSPGTPGEGRGEGNPQSTIPNPQSPQILIAGIGNIFLGDDAFGVHVARRLMQRTLPDGVRVVDFGIRGLDLVYALLDGCELAILIDAVPRGEAPGTLSVIEPERPQVTDPHGGLDLVEGHSMDPAKVLRLVEAMGDGGGSRAVGRILLVGCEPLPIDPQQEMQMDLSPAVQGAVEPAVQIVESLVAQHLTQQPPTKEVEDATQKIGLPD